MMLLDALCIAVLTGAGVFINRKIIYFLFAYLCVRKLVKKKTSVTSLITMMAIYSLIVPDNYMSEFFFILLFIVVIGRKRGTLLKQRRAGIFVLFWGIWSVISAVVNSVPLVNVAFSIISFAPLIMFLILSPNLEHININVDERQLDEILFIESIATVFNFIKFRGVATDAWSCGTFDDRGGEQAQLLVIIALLFFVYFEKYKGTGNRRTLYKCVVCFLIIVSTFSWVLMTVFGVIFIYCLYGSKTSRKKNNRKTQNIKLAMMIIIPVFVVALYFFSPQFIKNSLGRLISDASYIEYRFYKAIVYRITFIDIPGKDIRFLLFGNGLGYYCSRAALICTGMYVGFYKKFFSPSISHYTNQYLMNKIIKAHDFPGSDYGSVLARPYSSVLFIMGETGAIGFLLFLCWYITVVPRKKPEIRILLLFWLGVSFVENYFEYPKVLLGLFICCVVMTRNTTEKRAA